MRQECGRLLPTFLVIGAMKAGTTSLFRYLRTHPHVFMTQLKELEFFSHDENWSRGLEWYESQFGEGQNAKAVGEATTSYSKYPTVPNVPRRIASVIPNARIIYLVRDPIERIRSHYSHEVAAGIETRSIETALATSEEYANYSRYFMQLKQYLDYFPGTQILVVCSERLKRDRENTIRRIFDFLGVDGGWSDPILQQEFHQTGSKIVPSNGTLKLRQYPGYTAVSQITPEFIKRIYRRRGYRRLNRNEVTISLELTERLNDRLREDVAQLRRYLNDDLPEWNV
jgi:hypothetical protein